MYANTKLLGVVIISFIIVDKKRSRIYLKKADIGRLTTWNVTLKRYCTTMLYVYCIRVIIMVSLKYKQLLLLNKHVFNKSVSGVLLLKSK